MPEADVVPQRHHDTAIEFLGGQECFGVGEAFRRRFLRPEVRSELLGPPVLRHLRLTSLRMVLHRQGQLLQQRHRPLRLLAAGAIFT